ncbi:MAG: hypothetical protein IJ756_03915 [Paludibacteraceae bacterium]|nr:hypothetical protein [Paludibacteraceae bacterium]
MKKAFNLIMLIGLMALSFTSCKPTDEPNNTTSVEDVLIGKWENQSMLTDYWVYKSDLVESDISENENARWGYCWYEANGDEEKATYESDVLADYHGNGWFQWWVDNKTKLTYVHMMNASEASVPKPYTIVLINSTTLKIKDTFGNTTTYAKIK